MAIARLKIPHRSEKTIFTRRRVLFFIIPSRGEILRTTVGKSWSATEPKLKYKTGDFVMFDQMSTIDTSARTYPFRHGIISNSQSSEASQTQDIGGMHCMKR